MGSRHEAFLEQAPEPVRAEASKMPDLDARLDAVIAASGIPRERARPFLAWLGARIEDDAVLSRWLEELRVEDMALAWRCCMGDADALERFRELHETALRGAIARSCPKDLADETFQRVMVKLFVATDGAPAAITKFNGRGSLKGWVAVVGTREARTVLRGDKSREHVREEAAARLFDNMVDASHDPEIEHLKATYRAQFKAAFQTALGRLEPRLRNILRHEYVDGLRRGQIAALYGVHRVTFFRWREQAQRALLEGTRTIFEQEVELSPKDFDSVMRLIQSQLDVSLARVLKEDDGESQ